jgi:hypothetical protein
MSPLTFVEMSAALGVGGRLKPRNFGPDAGQRFFGLGGEGSFEVARERSSA